ncbi:hypothetical protein RS81_00064 [Microbacterium terrae]|uniref:Uncharacterized protein n=1 Tax=Microbacterium terrae TaxID=69369 RepID=A0A0M2HGK7_9MICO|nr:hypothetical protein RS81_00064 [Microbacterium terrae]
MLGAEPCAGAEAAEAAGADVADGTDAVGDGAADGAVTMLAEVSVTRSCRLVRSSTSLPGPMSGPPGTTPSAVWRFIVAAVAAAAPPTSVSPRAPATP